MPRSSQPPLYWITRAGPGRLATLSCPRGSELKKEIAQLRQQGVDVLVSLLTDAEVHDLCLQEEAAACQSLDIEFLRFPIPDGMVPASIPQTRAFARELKQKLNAGRTMAIHCRGGIGRSSLIAACVLVLEAIPSEVAFDRISMARGWEVPETEEQREWVAAFAKQVGHNLR